MKGIVLAGGHGTRLAPLTHITSKQLLPLFGRPMVAYPLNTLLEAGIEEILIITKPEYQADFQTLLGDGSKLGASFTYTTQAKPIGIADALRIGEKFIGNDTVALMLGDNVFEDSLAEAIQTFRGGGSIFATQVPNPERFGVVKLHPTGRVEAIVEKPTAPISPFAIPGCYLYDNRACHAAHRLTLSARGELEIVDVHNWFHERGELTVNHLNGAWTDVGTFDALKEETQWLRDHPQFAPGTNRLDAHLARPEAQRQQAQLAAALTQLVREQQTKSDCLINEEAMAAICHQHLYNREFV